MPRTAPQSDARTGPHARYSAPRASFARKGRAPHAICVVRCACVSSGELNVEGTLKPDRGPWPGRGSENPQDRGSRTRL